MLALLNEKLLQEYDKKYLLRNRRLIENRFDILVKIENKWVVNFCSNDYLNIATHPKVRRAFRDAAYQYGLGSGASNLISGFYQPHYEFEEAFAEFLNRDRVLLFNSGYHANLGVFQTFANRNSVVISDKLCHASLIDGIVISRAKHYRYSHQDLEQAEALLKQHAKKNRLLVTEGVFSMGGDITDLKKLSTIAREQQALLIVDDAHGFSILGQNGKGIGHYFNLKQEDIPCLITPLGKGLGGYGAMISGTHAIIENLLQFARTYRYTTSLPPAISKAAIAALSVLRDEPERQEKIRYLSTFFNAYARERGLVLVSEDPTAIKCVLIGSNKKVIDIQNKLLEKGFLVSGIRPPTVPLHGARLRICLNYLHTPLQITEMLDRIADFHLDG